jgi:hypothetical protein
MLVSYPNKVNPKKKYPIINILKLTESAQIKTELTTISIISKMVDLLPIFEAK